MKYYTICEYAEKFGVDMTTIAERFGGNSRQAAQGWRNTNRKIKVGDGKHVLVRPEKEISTFTQEKACGKQKTAL